MLLRISKLARSTYYYTLSKCDKDDENDEVMNEIITIFYNHKGRYGYRRITLELKNGGLIINHKKVKRLMRKMGLFGKMPKAKYKSYKGDMDGTCKNQLLNKVVDTKNHTTTYQRDFSTDEVNEKWTTDVTEFHIAAGKLYLSPILDMHCRDIVSYHVSRNPNYKQTQEMLRSAFKQHKVLDGLIFHSDQGWQYQMQHYHKALHDKGIVQSMSRKGNCLDNSPIENFFGIMKREMFLGNEYDFASLDELEHAIHEYIEYYNNERISETLKGMTPVQCRNHSSISNTI